MRDLTGYARAADRPPPPALGAHTREVLAEIGYAEAEIEAMIETGAAV